MAVLPLDQIRELLESGRTDAEIGAAMGVSRLAVQRFRKKYGLAPAGPVGQNSRTRDRDLTQPKMDGTNRLYPIHPGKPSLRIDLQSLRDDLLSEIRSIVSDNPWKCAKAPKPSPKGSLLTVYAPVDLHVGKLGWGAETGEDFDSAIAAERLVGSTSRLIELATPFGASQQLLVIGNDLLQVDNLLSATTAGTLQDTDSRYRKMFRLSVRLMADTISQLLTVAPVRVLVVPGNHDTLASFHVGEVLQAMYDKARDVTIDMSLMPRLYHQHGKNLLGFTHGHDEAHSSLPLIMAQERPKAWAETCYREFLIGHFHHRKQTQFVAGDSFNGVRVSILPSLTGVDSWHARKGYIGEPKSSESRIYDADAGPVAVLTATMSV